MIKRTLLFESPGKLTLRLGQLVWEGEDRSATVPIEDVGFVLLESQLVSISSALLAALSESGASVILCDKQHLPTASLVPFAGHTLTHKHLRIQVEASGAKRARLWRQLVIAKIENQASCVAKFDEDMAGKLRYHARLVKKDDADNQEAQAAFLYFGWLGKRVKGFKRDRDGGPPNDALNYGYALLRAAVARALVSSGLSCAFGLHHDNQYNAFCLADDVMEPYRPFIDRIVFSHLNIFADPVQELGRDGKRMLLQALVSDVQMGGETRPLMVALSQTTASLVRALEGTAEVELKLPRFPHECERQRG